MNSSRLINNIALIGFMGTGKSTVGRLVADSLHFEFLDTDELIEVRAGKAIAAIFAAEGEPAFRMQERKVVEELNTRQRTVISCGGGMGANAANLATLKEHALVICLWASPEKIWERVRTQTHRPLRKEADPLAKIRSLLTVREPIYKQADVLLNTELRPLKEVAVQVLHQFQLARAHPK